MLQAAEHGSSHICPHNRYYSCSYGLTKLLFAGFPTVPYLVDCFDMENPQSTIPQILKTYDPDPNNLAIYCSTCLLPHTAAHGKDKALLAFIKAGMPFKEVDDERELTPLHYAIMNHHSSTSALLLEHGADSVLDRLLIFF